MTDTQKTPGGATPGRATPSGATPGRAGEDLRGIVLDLLTEWEKGKVFSHVLIRDTLNKYDYMGGREKAFVKRLAEGTLERRIELDYVLEQYASIPVKKMKPAIRWLLRMAAYQILYMDGVPDSAAVNEAVKLAAKRKFYNLKGFVNGILRNVAKNKDAIVYPDAGKEPVLFLSVQGSMPQRLVEMWLENYGFDRTRRMLEAFLRPRPMTVRTAGRMDAGQREKWRESVEKAGVKILPHSGMPGVFDLYGAEGAASLPGYAEGVFTVQDVSSMLAVEAAGIRPGDFVLDVCAAPGGKTMLAAEKVLPGGRVEARDVSEARAEQIRENLERMFLDNVSVKVYDASEPDPSMAGRADVVLADVPCSGLGVIGKKQDIKYRLADADFAPLIRLQKAIVSQAAGYVKAGGVLLYSTCTINRQENEEMVKWICDTFPFVPEDIGSFLPEEFRKEAECGALQLLPGLHDCDGFFFARLKKTAE